MLYIIRVIILTLASWIILNTAYAANHPEFGVDILNEDQNGSAALFVFPRGRQDKAAWERDKEVYWQPLAAHVDYRIVGIYLKEGGKPFYRRSQRTIYEFIDNLKSQLKLPEKHIHIAGMSNGSVSAFSLALAYPDHVSSIISLSGGPMVEELSELKPILSTCIAMFTGELDSRIKGMMTEAKDYFEKNAAKFTYLDIPDQGHVIEGIANQFGPLFNTLEWQIKC